MTPEAKRVEALLALGKAEEAAALADSLPGRETPSPEFLRVRGRALRAAGRHFDAEASFREALSMQPSDAGLLADLATTLLGQKRHREALTFAREATAARPDLAAYHALVGVLAESLGLEEEAERELGAARSLSPREVDPHVVYGFHVLRQGRFPLAEAAFRDALGIDPQRAEAHMGLARTLVAQGRREEARHAWADARQLDPNLQDARLDAQLDQPRGILPILLSQPTWLSGMLLVGGMLLSLWSPWLAAPILAAALAGPVARTLHDEVFSA